MDSRDLKNTLAEAPAQALDDLHDFPGLHEVLEDRGDVVDPFDEAEHHPGELKSVWIWRKIRLSRFHHVEEVGRIVESEDPLQGIDAELADACAEGSGKFLPVELGISLDRLHVSYAQICNAEAH